jgi:hypothetical protein
VALTPWWPRQRPARAPSVLVTEGETDALAAETALAHARTMLRELKVVAIPGSGFPTSRLIDELRSVHTKRVWLALDADAAGNVASERLADALHASEIAASVVRLPTGTDLADSLVAAEDRVGWLSEAIVAAEPRGRGADAQDLVEARLLRTAGTLRRQALGLEAIRAALTVETEGWADPIDITLIDKVIAAASRWSAPPLWITDPIAFVDDPRLGKHERLILLVLCLRAKTDATRRIGIRRLAGIAKTSKGTMMTALERLREHDRISEKGRSRQREPTTYVIHDWSSAEGKERRVRKGSPEVPRTIDRASHESFPQS